MNEAENKIKFLIDTASSLSLVKPSALQDDVLVHPVAKHIKIQGIGKGYETAKYFVSLTLVGKVKHTFFVVSDNFPIDEQAVLGDDFMKDHNVIVDYSEKVLKFNKRKFPFDVKLETLLKICHKTNRQGKVEDRSNVSSAEETGSDYESNVDSCERKSDSQVSDSEDEECSYDSGSCERSSEKISDDPNSEVSTEGNSSEISQESECDDSVDSSVFVETDDGETFSTRSEVNSFEKSSSENEVSDNDFYADESSDDELINDNGSNFTENESLSDKDSEVCESSEDEGSKQFSEFENEENCKTISVPKRACIYAKVCVIKSGSGLISEMKFNDEVFSISSIVNAHDNVAIIPIFNTSIEDVEVTIPPLKLDFWDPEWDQETTSEVANCFHMSTANRIKKLLEKFNFSHLNAEESSEIKKLVSEFADIFYVEGDKIAMSETLEHEIQLKEATKPIKLKQFRIPFALKDEMKRNIDEMREADLIEESNSPWNLPTFLVPKKIGKDGKRKYRLVTDMRKLNNLIVQDVFPLPVIDDVLGKLGNARYFSVLDLWKGFYQIGLANESRKYTSFSACGKKWQYKRLPMGLKNSPAWFSRMMTMVLGELIDDSCMIYMDDMICFGGSLVDTIKNLKRVFTKLRESDLKLQPEKCDFLKKECLFLGHKITEDGIFPDESKFDAIKNFKCPTNRKQVRSFLGLTGFYRKFIQDYGKIAAPLNKLTSTNVDFKWEQKHQNAFEVLKEKLLHPPVLTHPDFDKEFILTTDASGTGIAGVLSQIQEGKERPIGFCSRALKPREATFAKDNATETELLALKWSIQYFRPYLYGKKFTVFTDNKALIHLDKMNNANPRIMKYKLELEEFDFIVKYKEGKRNGNADALSRMFLLRQVVDDLEKEEILTQFHSSLLAGHKGIEATLKKIKDAGFTWPNLRRDVKKFIQICNSCQKNKLYLKTKLPMQITDTPTGPLEKIAIDLVEELPVTAEGFKHILTVQDNFSKFLWGIPLRSKSAEEVAQAFAQEIILKTGTLPAVVLSDQGTNFESKIFKNLCKLFKIKKIRTTSHRPQGNGSLERCHRSLKEYFRHFINDSQSNWSELLPMACFAHNTTVHSVTNFTPFEILHGFKAKLPSSFVKEQKDAPFYATDDYVAQLKNNLTQSYKIVRENLIKGKNHNKEYYDKTLNEVTFKVGDQVQLLNENVRQGRSKKLGPQWIGPYVVTNTIGDTNYEISKGRKTMIVHGDKLKNYYD